MACQGAGLPQKGCLIGLGHVLQRGPDKSRVSGVGLPGALLKAELGLPLSGQIHGHKALLLPAGGKLPGQLHPPGEKLAYLAVHFIHLLF